MRAWLLCVFACCLVQCVLGHGPTFVDGQGGECAAQASGDTSSGIYIKGCSKFTLTLDSAHGVGVLTHVNYVHDLVRCNLTAAVSGPYFQEADSRSRGTYPLSDTTCKFEPFGVSALTKHPFFGGSFQNDTKRPLTIVVTHSCPADPPRFIVSYPFETRHDKEPFDDIGFWTITWLRVAVNLYEWQGWGDFFFEGSLLLTFAVFFLYWFFYYLGKLNDADTLSSSFWGALCCCCHNSTVLEVALVIASFLSIFFFGYFVAGLVTFACSFFYVIGLHCGCGSRTDNVCHPANVIVIAFTILSIWTWSIGVRAVVSAAEYFDNDCEGSFAPNVIWMVMDVVWACVCVSILLRLHEVAEIEASKEEAESNS